MIRVPRTTGQWLVISKIFETRWNFVVRGKRVLLQQPSNNRSNFYDYKGHNSILSIVAVGPEYEILLANVGINGRMSDEDNSSRNKFRHMIANPENSLNTRLSPCVLNLIKHSCLCFKHNIKSLII